MIYWRSYKKLFIYWGILVLIPCSGFGQAPLSNRVANYKMSIFLDTEEKMTRNHTEFLWNNPSADTINELQFHLYYNAFKNDQSTFLQGSNFSYAEDKCDWGWSTITSIKDAAGNDLTPNLRYIQPNDDNAQDQTVLLIPLAEPVMPYASVQLDFDWEAKIPKLMIRTGYNRDYYFMAQWFPKVGVYEGEGIRCSEKGKWNCNQYHRSTEYYSDFGLYEVALDVPNEYVVGASGKRVQEEAKEERTIYTYLAEDVIDFTWTAYPNFEEATDKWEGVDIRLLHHPDRACVVERYMESAKYCFEYLNEHVGEYPYETLTIVDPPYHGIRSSGMEYPTLITGAGFYCMPHGIRTTETITAHEMIHQYFMQMVASNEQEDAWMDEGFTAYYESRIIDHYYDYIMESDWIGVGISNDSWRRYRYVTADTKIGKSAQAGWFFRHGNFGPLVYGKTAVSFNTLEGIVGLEVMDEIMKTYFERWKFKHPCGQNFIDVVSEVTRKHHGNRYGDSMDWFFEQTVYSTNECDYELLKIENKRYKAPTGYVENNTDCVILADSESANYESKVIVYRKGEIQVPIEVLVTFENGDTKLVEWDGKARSEEFTFQTAHKISCAELDPEYKIDLDMNCMNNSIDLQAPTAGVWKYVSTWMRWVQNTMQSMTFLI